MSPAWCDNMMLTPGFRSDRPSDFASDFNDEDTDPAAPEPQRRTRADGDPSYELVWVEEAGYGMVLRVRRITPIRPSAIDGAARQVGK